MSQILVTGGSGYVGTQLIAALLRAGRPVRATVHSAAREAGLRAAVRRGGADDAGLEVAVADLMADDGWKAAVAGCEEVHHVATPIPAAQPEDPDELVVRAREGTLRVLRAARDAGARRVVLTSSFAAVGYTPKPGAEFTEDDWTDPGTPGLAPYPRSKVIAERAAGHHSPGPGDCQVHGRSMCCALSCSTLRRLPQLARCGAPALVSTPGSGAARRRRGGSRGPGWGQADAQRRAPAHPSPRSSPLLSAPAAGSPGASGISSRRS